MTGTGGWWCYKTGGGGGGGGWGVGAASEVLSL